MRLLEVRRVRLGPALLVSALLFGCYGYIGDPAHPPRFTPEVDAGVQVQPDATLPPPDTGVTPPPVDGGLEEDGGITPPPDDAGFLDAGTPPPPPECDDGLDNDGDGLVDWTHDLGCWGVEDPTEGGLSNSLDNGWTVFEPSSDTRIVYVSSSSGDDAWSGLAPEWDGTDGPKKTAAAGIARLRDGRPDWLLFKRGDVWTDEVLGNWPISGRSEAQPAVIASYGGSLVRPRFDVSASFFETVNGGGVSLNRSHVRLLGLHVRGYARDPDDPRFTGQGEPCINWLHAGGDFLVEDVKCEYAQVNLQGVPTLPFAIRRSVFTESYSLNTHAQGLFSIITVPLLLEENVFHHGGHSDQFRLALWAPQTNPGAWSAITDGQVRFVLDGQAYDLEGLDFSGASSMNGVATVLQAALRAATGDNTIRLLYSAQGHAFQLRAPALPEGEGYEVRRYVGATLGTDLVPLLVGVDTKVGGPAQGSPNSTIFNRNLYIATGFGRTVMRGNVDADGASGGTQLRMGGLYDDNLSLRNAHALVIGSVENYGDTELGGEVMNSVALGSRDISTQRQGTGYLIESNLATRGTGRPSIIRGLSIHDNILAHNALGTANIRALQLEGTGTHHDVEIYGNLIYDWARPAWADPLDQRAFGIGLLTLPGSSNVFVHDNWVQQPGGGFAIATLPVPAGLRLARNTYWSAAPNPPDIWSRGWYFLSSSATAAEWAAATGETGLVEARLPFIDPDRGVETYMATLGGEATYEAFIAAALGQSKHAWRPELAAPAVNDYIRDGFRLDTSR
jgi:hypothetical protein